MGNDKNIASFGRYLQAKRLEKKISLDQVAEETRIGLGTLLLIEQEDLDQLPVEVFVKGFLRAYAKAVGADGDEAIRRFELRVNIAQKIAAIEAAPKKQNARLWLKFLFSLALLAGLIAGTLYSVYYFRDAAVKADRKHQFQVNENSIAIPEKADNEPVAAEESNQSVSGKLHLNIKAAETTWVKIIADAGDPMEYQLNAGEKLTLEAIATYNIMIGDAGSVQLKLNGKAIIVPGKKGEVVSLLLP